MVLMHCFLKIRQSTYVFLKSIVDQLKAGPGSLHYPKLQFWEHGVQQLPRPTDQGQTGTLPFFFQGASLEAPPPPCEKPLSIKMCPTPTTLPLYIRFCHPNQTGLYYVS